MEPNIAAVLLAAGASSRMGRPKQLLDYRGESFLDRQIALYSGVCGSVVVVLGYNAGEITAALQRTEQAVFVLNPRPERGQLSSLQCGLRAVSGTCEAIFFLPVDSPGVREETLQSLVAVWRNQTERPDFVIPRNGGRNGHPVLMRAAIAADLLALPADASAREVVHARAGSSICVDVSDAWIHRDIDTPEDYAAMAAEVSE